MSDTSDDGLLGVPGFPGLVDVALHTPPVVEATAGDPVHGFPALELELAAARSGAASVAPVLHLTIVGSKFRQVYPY